MMDDAQTEYSSCVLRVAIVVGHLIIYNFDQLIKNLESSMP